MVWSIDLSIVILYFPVCHRFFSLFFIFSKTLEMDPCLDDCVMFAKKLKRLNRPVTLDILKGLPHGFLNFTMVI